MDIITGGAIHIALRMTLAAWSKQRQSGLRADLGQTDPDRMTVLAGLFLVGQTVLGMANRTYLLNRTLAFTCLFGMHVRALAVMRDMTLGTHPGLPRFVPGFIFKTDVPVVFGSVSPTSQGNDTSGEAGGLAEKSL